jgi:hypothetical protein
MPEWVTGTCHSRMTGIYHSGTGFEELSCHINHFGSPMMIRRRQVIKGHRHQDPDPEINEAFVTEQYPSDSACVI